MELQVYQDPAGNDIVIETGIPEKSLFKLFDAIGTLVISASVSDQEHLCVDHLADGLYHYKLHAGDKLLIGKITLIR
jgi:hypothetical protein